MPFVIALFPIRKQTRMGEAQPQVTDCNACENFAVLQRTTRFRSAGSRYDRLRSNATGPQIVSRRGIDTAVMVSVKEWRKLNDEERLTWKDVLLGEGPRFEIPLPKRGTGRWRKPVVFD
jgi:antitoxin Phd